MSVNRVETLIGPAAARRSAPWDLDDDEVEPGAIIRRPERGVIVLLNRLKRIGRGTRC